MNPRLLFSIVRSGLPLLAQLALAHVALSQVPPAVEWQRTLGGTSAEDARSIQPTSDGGYIITGPTDSNNGDVTGAHGDEDCWVVKVDASGSIQWEKALGGSGFDRSNSIRQTSDGGYVMAGASRSNDGDVTGNHGLLDQWVVKLDAQGGLQWQRSFGGSDDDEAESVEQTPDGGYVVTGYTQSTDGDVSVNHGSGDLWVLKLDAAGALEWQKTFGGSEFDSGSEIKPTTDGGYVVVGTSSSNNGDVNGNHGSPDCWVVKLNANGTLSWQRTLGGSAWDTGRSIAQTTDEGYIVAGDAASTDGDLTYNHGGLADMWVVKLTDSGAIQWQKALGGSDIDQSGSVVQTNDEGYAVVGITASSNGDVTNAHGNNDNWLVRLDATGALIWEKTMGGSFFESALSIAPTNDGGYVVAGSTNSTDGDVVGNDGGYDYWIVKLATDVTAIEEDMDNTILSVFPNPTSSMCNVEFATDAPAQIQLVDALGQQLGVRMNTQRSGGRQGVQFSIADLPAGSYYVRFKTHGSTGVRELIKQ